MKVLQVTDTLDLGGAEKMAVNLSNLLILNDLKVDLLCVSKLGQLQRLVDERITITSLNRKNKFNLLKIIKLSRLLVRYDIIHVHMRHTYRYVKLASIFNLNKSHIILHDHTGKVDKDQSIPLGLNTILKPDYYIGVSQALVDWAINRLNINPSRVLLLKNIIHTPKNLKQQAKKTFFVQVGNFKENKNQLYSLQLAHKMNKSITFYGNIGEKAYFAKIKKYIVENNLQDQVIIIHNEHEVIPRLHNYSVALHTSNYESGPLVLIEYLYANLPFLTFETGEVTKIIKEQYPDMVIDGFNEKNWAKRIDAISKSSKYKDLNNFFREQFSPDNYLSQCLNLYNKVLSNA